MTHSRFPVLLAAALLASCSSGEKEEAQPSATPTASPTAEAGGRIFTYTSLEGCKVLESNEEEAGYFLTECKGEGGYRLQVTESDLRQSVTLIAPDGTKTALDLSALTGGGFSNLGKTVEWRGALKDGVFAPDVLILRHEVVTDAEGTKTTSYLVVVRLVGRNCAMERVDPGPHQNEQARAIADGEGKCLKGGAA